MLPIKYLFTDNNRATNGSIRSFFQVWEWTLVCSNPLPSRGRPIISDWCLPSPVPRGGHLPQVNTILGGFKQIPNSLFAIR